MEIVQGKDSFNEMATGILVKLFADYPFYSSFDFSDFGWKPRGDRTQIDLLCNTLQALSDMGYTEIISSTDMDTAAKLTPRGLNLLQQQAPGAGDAVINVLKGAAGETRSAVIGAIIGWIFGGK
ncbi:hypothetical protein ACVNAN_004903 [Enterobacter hormaechei]|uniref:hypothetical protein n=1 Tax=Enterobacter cloacae complex TaxID=354276 RepID=UPI0004514A69|nr:MULTISPECIES: hypothetical protein [Enterobacter cloacae complex]AIE62819.1 hypothetical protein ECNIH2_05390 [Enterobacter cloacae ECNIH2]AKK76438.1 hypothetical protein ABY62_07125 [Enterobacter hormaechei]AKK93780.1 hypothetical protein ABY65_21505 [Enterobacter hormaechei]AKK95078.1 hypothetical protein ABY64_03495 [Enterobacter hormaechei]AKL50447.1 hypothetical protein AB285_03330 [Enterobacter hormaechei]